MVRHTAQSSAVWRLTLVAFASLLWCSWATDGRRAAAAQDPKRLEEFNNKIQALTAKLAGCGQNAECIARVSEEIRRTMREWPDPLDSLPAIPVEGGLSQVRVPCSVTIVNRTEYQHMDKGPGANWSCEKRPPDRVYPATYWLFEYEAREEGALDYVTGFARFNLQAPKPGPYLADAPGDFKVRQQTGYRQGWEAGPGGTCILKRYPDGRFLEIASGNKTFVFRMARLPVTEKTHIYFGPIAVQVENADRSCPGCPFSMYDPDGISEPALSESQHNPSEFVITPADMQAALDAGRLDRTFHWRQSIDELGGYKDNRLSVSIEFRANPGSLAVIPQDGFESAGPDDAGQFIPASRTYTVRNVGGSAIRFGVSKGADWVSLSSADGQLGPGASTQVTVSIAPRAKSLRPNTYEDQIRFTNQTNGQGDTARPVKLDVGEIQVWDVKLTGQETDDLGGSLMYMKTEGLWKSVAVDYGIRFDYTMAARVTLKKEKGGGLKYAGGQITGAQIGYSQNFDPAVFSIPRITCQNCQDVPNLKGKALAGSLQGSAVRLLWPSVVTRVIVTNALKLQSQTKEKSQQGYSDNYFESAEFLQRATDHLLPLRDGETTFAVRKTSAIERYKLDKRKPITISYRYLLKRVQ